MRVRLLDLDDVVRYLANFARLNAESGRDGGIHFHSYSRSESYLPKDARERERRRWSTPLTEGGWRRAWGLMLDEHVVGHLYLAGGTHVSEMHRVRLGMGVRRRHHRQGGGRRLLGVAIEWARAQPCIDWIDLGVFEENVPAIALYAGVGFAECGRTRDRYWVDGHRIDAIEMSLYVG